VQKSNSSVQSNSLSSNANTLITPAFILLLVETLLYMTSVMMPAPIIIGHCSQLGISGTWSGVVSGCFNLIALFFRPVAGSLSDRLDLRQLSFLGLLILAIGTCGIALSHVLPLLLLFRLAGGIGFALSSVSLSTSVAVCAPPGKTGKAIGIYSLVQAMGTALGPTAGTELASRFSFRTAFLFATALATAGAVLSAVSHLMVWPENTDKTALSAQRRLGIVSEALPIAIMVMLVVMPYSAIAAFLRTIVQEEDTNLSISSYFIVLATFMLVVRLILSKWIDSWPFRRFCLISIPASTAAILILLLSHSTLNFMAAALCMSASYGLMLPVCQTSCVRLVDANRQGQANSTYYIGLDLGTTLGATIAGLIYDYWGSAYVLPFMLICPLMASLLVLTKKVK
jgi:predicted MFS family arabinose efflux permease